MCVIIISILAIFGIIGIMEVQRAVCLYIYETLPKLPIEKGNFFSRKLGISNVDSLGKYLKAKINIRRNLKRLTNLTDIDLSTHDIDALFELKQFIQYLLSEGSLCIGHHCKYKLRYGKLDLHLLVKSESSLSKSVAIRFQSFSQDSPVLTIILNLSTGELDTSYCFNTPNLSLRFIEPNVTLIKEIKEFINMLGSKVALNSFAGVTII